MTHSVLSSKGNGINIDANPINADWVKFRRWLHNNPGKSFSDWVTSIASKGAANNKREKMMVRICLRS